MVDFALSDRVAASGRRGVGGTLIQHFLVQIYLTPRGLISFFWFAVVRGAFNAEYFMIHFGAVASAETPQPNDT